VQKTLTRALAQVVRERPAEQAGAFVRMALEKGHPDLVSLLPAVAAELRKLGDEVRAGRVEGK